MKALDKILLGILFLATAGAGFAWFHTLGGSWSASNSAIECPTVFEFGELQVGELVTLPFPVANRGSADLVISNITSSCGCLGLSQLKAGEYERIVGARVAPGATAELFLRFRVTGMPGERFEHFLSIVTNDPVQRLVRARMSIARVRDRLRFEPAKLSVGDLAPGRTHEFTIAVFAGREETRKVVRVATTQPEAVSVSFEAGELDQAATEAPESLQGTIRVRIQSGSAMELLGNLLIYVDEATEEEKFEPYATVSLSGRIAPWLEIIPARAVLPRRGNDGWIFTARFTCRTPEANGLILTPIDLPSGLRFERDSESSKGQFHVRIVPAEIARDQGQLSFRLRWQFGEQSGTEKVTVLLNPAWEDRP